MTHRRPIIILLVISALAVSANSTAYYVSPTGNDTNSGLSEPEAWASIDRGDVLGVLNPGDTVWVSSGAYFRSSTVNLTQGGMSNKPLLYAKQGIAPAILDFGNAALDGIVIEKNQIIIRGITVANAGKDGIRNLGNGIQITDCVIHHSGQVALHVSGGNSLFLRNIIYSTTGPGVKIEAQGPNTLVYGNTIYGGAGDGITFAPEVARVFNNIIVSCNRGITGGVDNECGYNSLWNNSSGNYAGSARDSQGGKSADPLFVNAANGDFRLGVGSPAIDAGLDLGYDFNGTAPDMGALETEPGELHHIEIIPVRDTLSADSTYQFTVLAYDSSNNPAPTGVLTWSHTFATGAIDSNGLFTPLNVGAGTISVVSSLNGVTASTGSMYVRPGAAIDITVVPDSLTIAAGSTHLFAVSGFDKHANAVSDLGLISWSVTGNIGTIDTTGLFTALQAGAGTVVAHSDLGLNDSSGMITVTPGPFAVLDVLPSTNVVPTLQSYQYVALGYDAYSNLIADFTDSVTWTTTDAAGGITPTGLYTAGLVGSYWVKGVYSGIRDSGAVDVALGGGLDHIVIEFFDGTPVGGLALTTDIDTTQFYARGYSATRVVIGDVPVTWSILGSDSVGDLTPTLGAKTELSLRRPSAIKIVASHSGGFADTTGGITVSVGDAVSLQVFPDTATIQSGDTLRFTTTARDADGNPADPQPVPVWSVSGGIGTLIDEGLFAAQYTGLGHLIATAGGLFDSSGLIAVVAGPLARIAIEPDTVIVGINDTVQFTAIGLDSLGNTTDPGVVTWKALGRTGSIDSGGRYIATTPGVGAVSVINHTAGLADTTASLRVEELYFTTIPIGNRIIHPGGDEAPVAIFRIDNYFSEEKTVTAVSVRDMSSGAGTANELAANMATARIYVDRDSDSTLSPADSLLAETAYATGVMAFSILPMDMPADSGLTFIVTVTSALMARDGDTVDVSLIPGLDIETADMTIVAGPPLSNSLGITQIDGMVAEQIEVISTGSRTVRPADTLQLAMTLDVPRSGYKPDTLIAFTIVNRGTASESDFDSLVLFADNGDGQWNGASVETLLGRMVFNGENWSRGALAVSLADSVTRFFVAARLDPFPKDGATILLGIPVDGVKVSSGNDGPIDLPVFSLDTLIVEGRQALVTTVVPVPARLCVPGQPTGTLLAVQLVNEYPQPIGLDSCAFSFVSTDPQGASAVQLEAQVDSVYLYLDKDADASTISAADSLITASQIQDGTVIFDINALSIAGNGGSGILVVSAKLGLRNCKNGNTIGFTLADSAALSFDRSVAVSGNFPLQNPAPFTINAFPAAAVVTHALSTGNLYAGQVEQPVLDLELPRNGYAADKLIRLDLVNTGTLSEDQVLETVRLWKDLTGNGFSPDDIAVGTFETTGFGWRLEDVQAALDSPLNRFVVTVSVSGGQFNGGTLRFDLPLFGATTASGITGPDDMGVQNPSSFLVFPSNRVTAISIPLATLPVTPGSTGHTLMTFALYNGYTGQTKTLNQVTLTNSSRSIGSAGFADHELGQVSLFWDVNKNRVLDDDQLIGTGLFTGGKLRFDGFAAPLPSESLAYFFVIAALPLDLIDGDSLTALIEQTTDFSFTDFVNLNGDLPLTSGRYLVVDGSVRQQYEVFGPVGHSLAPGDTDIVLLAFSPAHNGDQQDWLNEVVVHNLGTAESDILSELSLWHDVNTDNMLNDGDTSLGLFVYQGDTWLIADLGLSVSSFSPHLFVVGSIATSTLPNATIQMGVPEMGCDYQSGNDGPNDSSLVAPGVSTISTSGLKIHLETMRASYSVGQTIDVAFSIINATSGSLDSANGTLLEIEYPSLVRFDSSTTGPVYLSAGQEFTCHYFFTAISEGTERWTFRAISGVPVDSSATIQTPMTLIQRAISPVSPRLLSTSPTGVTQGQTNVFPLTIECAHPDTGAAVAAISIQSLRLRVIDGAGSSLPANSVFSRMAVATGYDILSVLTVVPSQSDISFTFGNPVTISPGNAQSIMLIADIAPGASAEDFRISVDSATWVPFVDANSGQIIPTAPSITYPLRTALTRIDSPSQQIAVSAVSCALPTINYGQQDAGILKLLVRHSGQPGSSAVQLTRLSLEVIDSLGGTLSPADLFDRITLWRQNYLIGSVIISPLDSTEIDVPFSTPLNVNAQEIDSIEVAVSVKASTATGGFSLRIADSSQFTVRDLNTGSALLAVSDTTLASGMTFPIVSNWSAFRMPAEPPSICLSNVAPASIALGADSVRLLAFAVKYDALPQNSSVRLTKANMTITDGSGGSIDPDQLFDRVGIYVGTGPTQYNQFMTVLGGALQLHLADSGILLSPGDSIGIEFVGDLRAEAPYSEFAVRILNIGDFVSYDVSDPNHVTGAVTALQCNQLYPFSTTTTSILLPAGRPVAARSTRPVQIASAGSRQVVIFDGTLTYNSPSPLGDLEVRGLNATLSRRGADESSLEPISASVSRVHLEIDGIAMGTDSTLAGNAVAITSVPPITLGRGETIRLRITCDLAQNARPGNLLMTLADSTFLTIIDKNLAAPVYPILSGSGFPVTAGEISIVAADLKSSFTNYPNPFNPAQGEITNVGFVLTENATVDIDLFTVTGESVYRVASRSYRLAGAHQSDSWSGFNGEGQAVVPGVYFCRITATYDSGRIETFRRKIAVVR